MEIVANGAVRRRSEIKKGGNDRPEETRVTRVEAVLARYTTRRRNAIYGVLTAHLHKCVANKALVALKTKTTTDNERNGT